MHIVAGVDLGGTAVNYTLVDFEGRFLIDGLCEHPARAVEGPDVCLKQIVEGLNVAVTRAGASLGDITHVGLDTPGPASAEGVLSARGSTNFVHQAWAGLDLPKRLSEMLGRPVTYLNDGNAGALWGHWSHLRAAGECHVDIGDHRHGARRRRDRQTATWSRAAAGLAASSGTSWSRIRASPESKASRPHCNCGRMGDLESLCSLTAIRQTLLPWFLAKNPGHELGTLGDTRGRQARARDGRGRRRHVSRDLPRAGPRAGPVLRSDGQHLRPGRAHRRRGSARGVQEFQRWFLAEIRAGMPVQRQEQADIPIRVMPNGDTAGARGQRSRRCDRRGRPPLRAETGGPFQCVFSSSPHWCSSPPAARWRNRLPPPRSRTASRPGGRLA